MYFYFCVAFFIMWSSSLQDKRVLLCLFKAGFIDFYFLDLSAKSLESLPYSFAVSSDLSGRRLVCSLNDENIYLYERLHSLILTTEVINRSNLLQFLGVGKNIASFVESSNSVLVEPSRTNCDSNTAMWSVIFWLRLDPTLSKLFMSHLVNDCFRS